MKIANGTFTRKSPALFAERAELPLGWAVIRHGHLGDKGKRREVTYRWAAIKSDGNKIFRVIRFGATLESTEIVLDWPGWIDLQGRSAETQEAIDLEIRSPKKWEFFQIPFCHVDPGYRMSAWLGAISIGLGLLSLALAFLV